MTTQDQGIKAICNFVNKYGFRVNVLEYIETKDSANHPIITYTDNDFEILFYPTAYDFEDTKLSGGTAKVRKIKAFVIEALQVKQLIVYNGTKYQIYKIEKQGNSDERHCPVLYQIHLREYYGSA